MQRRLLNILIVTCAVLSLQLLHPTTGYAQGFTRLQVLLPGELPAPGTGSGKSGTPRPQTVGVPFQARVRACDDSWNTVTSITDVVRLSSTDVSATLPGATALAAGETTLQVTMNAAGAFTISATDQSDNTIPLATSAQFDVYLVHGFEFTRINQKNQYAGTPMAISFEAVDPSGQRVNGFSGPVSLQQITSFGVGRIVPDEVNLTNGFWSGSVTMYRADETAINRGNVNIYAFLDANPGVNGTSDPFTVHPGTLARVQIVVPGQSPAPGSVSGTTGSPASQSAGQPFAADVYSTDAYWNQLPTSDTVRITSSDPQLSVTPPNPGVLNAGFRRFTLALGTVGMQTLSVSDQTPGVQGMTSAPIMVITNAQLDHFEIDPIAGPVTAGTPVAVHIRATDVAHNTKDYNGSAILTANTGPGSISPELITFTSGEWSGNMVFRGAGGAVSFTCSDFASPPHTGTSAGFVVQPGPYVKLQVLLPGQTPQGGTATGFTGTPTQQSAGTPFNVQVRACDAFWNRVSGINHRLGMSSTDAFAAFPANPVLANGEVLLSVTLFKSGSQTITAADLDDSNITPHTSSAVQIVGGAYARIVILVPGQTLAPGTPSGQDPDRGTAESINISFQVDVYATDQWFNPVTGVSDLVRVISPTDARAYSMPDSVELPHDFALVDGHGEMRVRMTSGGFQQLMASNVTQPSMPPSTTQMEVIETGFHLQAFMGPDNQPDTAQAGEQFALTVRLTNDAGSVINEGAASNAFVNVTVFQAGGSGQRLPARGRLDNTRFQLLQGERVMPEFYTFAEPIILEIQHDATEIQPATTERITIVPGAPDSLLLSSDPTWVRGNKHATLSALLIDRYHNGIPDQPMTFALVSGGGEVTPTDSLTDATGVAHADFHSAREPQVSRVRATAGNLVKELDIETAFVDPNAPGGTIASYPNPFHPGEAPTTIAYKLDDNARVTLRVFTLSGGLVLRQEFPMGEPGGMVGMNEFVWDGKNGKGELVSSGGYIVVVEAQGTGETLHTMRRKIAVVR